MVCSSMMSSESIVHTTPSIVQAVGTDKYLEDQIRRKSWSRTNLLCNLHLYVANMHFVVCGKTLVGKEKKVSTPVKRN